MTGFVTIEKLQEHFQNQGFDALIEDAGLLLQREPDNVRALYWRACASMRLDRMDEALVDLNRAIDLYDEYADAFSQRGVLFFRKGYTQRALADLDHAVRLEPGNAYRYASRAYVRASANELERAIKDYERAIALDPEDAVAHNNLGLLQEQLGYKSQAQRNLERASDLAVNRHGELVPLPGGETNALPGAVPSHPSGYGEVLREVLTSRAGFRGYLRFLNDTFRERIGRLFKGQASR